MPFKVSVAPECVRVRLALIDKVSPVATSRVFETVRSDVCSVIVPADAGSIVKLYSVLPPGVIVFDVPVIVTVEVPGVMVPPAMLKFPATVWVSLAKVIVPEKVRC